MFNKNKKKMKQLHFKKFKNKLFFSLRIQKITTKKFDFHHKSTFF